uniref:ADP-ribosylation factor-binding protein GGA1 n=1 Tax=Phallusia mammillata TaxID=59560 RepID=A0A6F9DD04_9ASCI|nr:ADP-ribosylation factor-binding protein GGA1 [Phallusia mammillata]
MAVNMDEETMETLLNKATSSLNREEDWEYIMGFCDKVNNDIEGPQNSTRLLAHKIQSPQEKEALQALSVLEACVKNCGELFHKELGKYRFLNELIKVVSPKYLGTKTSEQVQKRVISLLYAWSVGLTDQIKIRDAYQMLKKQGIITDDPEFDVSLISNPPPPRDDRDNLFQDEDKKKQLERLLRSTRPEDLQAANRLIKNVVQEDEAKMDKLRRRNKTLEEVNNNVRVLNEMLAQFKPETPVTNMQTMKEIYDGCQKLRPTLFRLASDTDDDETALMDILRANDDVSRVMQSFEKLVQPRLTSMTDRKGDGAASEPAESSEQKPDNSSNMLDLAGLSLQSTEPPSVQTNTDTYKPFTAFEQQPTSNGVDENLLLSFPSTNTVTNSAATNDVNSLFSLDDLMANIPSSTNTTQPAPPTLPVMSSMPVTSSAPIPKLPSPPQQKPQLFSDLGEVSRNMMEQSLGRKLEESFPAPVTKPTLNDLSNINIPPKSQPPQSVELPSLGNLGMTLIEPTQQNDTPPVAEPVPSIPADGSLADVFVALENIRPSTFTPVTVYDNNSIRILMHFAKDHAIPSRTDTLVAVVSMLSTRTNPVQNILFQAAAPKIMKVKLQPPSSTELPAFNPIFSAPPLTQVMVVANPSKKEVKIRYKLDYKIDDQTAISDSGIITGFPPCEQWGKL